MVVYFLYFLLICHFLFEDENEEIEVAEKVMKREISSQESRRGKENDKRENSENEYIEIVFNKNKILKKIESSLSVDIGSQNIFLNLTAPVMYLHFSDSINLSHLLLDLLREKKKTQLCYDSANDLTNDLTNEVVNDSSGEALKHIMSNVAKNCAKLFEGSLLAVSTCSFLNNHMFTNSFEKSRNFTFIYFVPKLLNKPTLVGLIEQEHICKKCEWIKLKDFFEKEKNEKAKETEKVEETEGTEETEEIEVEEIEETKEIELAQVTEVTEKKEEENKEMTEENKYFLICLLGNKIKIYEMEKCALLMNFLFSIKHQECNVHFVENHFIKNNIIQELLTYEISSTNNSKSNEVLSDFSYSIYIENKKRFLKLALCFNNFQIKIVTFSLCERNEMNNKFNNMINSSKPINISLKGNIQNLDFVFERREKIVNEDPNHKLVNLENENYKKEKNYIKRKSYEKKEKKNEINSKKFDTKIVETVISLNQGILSFCSFFPSLNSFLLCVSSNDGSVIIIDIRNGKELYFMKRKVQAISHVKWYDNSCIFYGQEKGVILNLYEQKKTLNIDKSHIITYDVLCLHSCLFKNHFAFTFDDASILIGKFRKTKRTKLHFKDLFLWQTKQQVTLDAEFLLKLTCMKLEKPNWNCFSHILLHEHIQGLCMVFDEGVKLSKMQKYDIQIEKEKIPRALSVKSISSAVFEQVSLVAYGNASGLIHIFLEVHDGPLNI